MLTTFTTVMGPFVTILRLVSVLLFLSLSCCVGQQYSPEERGKMTKELVEIEPSVHLLNRIQELKEACSVFLFFSVSPGSSDQESLHVASNVLSCVHICPTGNEGAA